MGRGSSWGVALACCVTGSSWVSVAHAQPPQEPAPATEGGEAQATALFQEGVASAKAEDYANAYDKLKRSFDMAQRFDTAANLSFVEQKLGKKRDAAEHLAYALRTFPTTGAAEKRERMQGDLAALEKDIGRVTVDCPPGTVVTINGKSVGIAPVIVQYVDVGAVTVTGVHDKLGDGEGKAQAAAGQSLTIKLTLVPREAPPRPIWPAIVLGSLAGVTAGGGIAGFVVSSQRASEADALATNIENDGGCAKNPALCAEGDEVVSERDLFLGLGIAGVAVSGASIIGMIVYLALPNPRPERPSDKPAVTFQVVPMLGPTTGAAFLGSF